MNNEYLFNIALPVSEVYYGMIILAKRLDLGALIAADKIMLGRSEEGEIKNLRW